MSRKDFKSLEPDPAAWTGASQDSDRKYGKCIKWIYLFLPITIAEIYKLG